MASNNPFIPNGASAPSNTPTPGTPVSNDSFEIDLTNVQSGFTIPDGNYKAKCVEIEQGVSKSGNPQFIWTFEVTEGDHIGWQGKVFTALTPAAMWKVAETVIALGVGQSGSVVKFKRTDVLNKECGILVEKNGYNGNERSQISKVISLKELMESGS